jgi:polyphosphate kinase 2 (PPK2 family)
MNRITVLIMDSLVPKDLSLELNRLQLKLHEENVPVLIIFEGNSGRILHRVISEVIRCLEPRGVTYNHFDPSSDGPRLIFDYLQYTPAKGSLSLYDRSWYSMIVDRYDGDPDNMEKMSEMCRLFEKYLVNNGVFLIKVFLEASPEDVKTYADDYSPDNSSVKSFLSVDKIDPVKYRTTMSSGLFKNTDTACSPWVNINVGEKDKTVSETVKNIISRMAGYPEQAKHFKTRSLSTYENPRAGLELDGVCKNYEEELAKQSERIYELQAILAGTSMSMVIGFEGWDAAGKGSAIKHLTHALNPRGYSVKQVKAPNDEEANHTYLWRFCKDMPSEGRITVFDRTWYGRMMVEPVEGFCTEEEYRRASSEINDMEESMSRQGTIVIKFWLDISPEEQLKRFEKRCNDPIKQWKLTEEDWRNREKRDVYEKYIDRMMVTTNTQWAPWNVIPANNKKYARVLVLQTVADRLQNAIDRYLSNK